MDTEHKATLQMLVPMVIKVITEKKNITAVEAIQILYVSKLYETLENESTKLWHLSPLALFELLERELNSEKIIYPVGI